MCENKESECQTSVADLLNCQLPQMFRIRGMKHYESHEHASAHKYLYMEKKVLLFTQGYKSVNFRCLFLIGKKLIFSDSIT